MSSTSTSRSAKGESPKRLDELLKEQQEPFLLDCYLHQHGYKKRKIFGKKKLSKGFITNFFSNSIRKVKMGTDDFASYCTRFAINLCKKLVSTNGMFRFKASDRGKFKTTLWSTNETVKYNRRELEEPLSSTMDSRNETEEYIFSSSIWESLIHKLGKLGSKNAQRNSVDLVSSEEIKKIISGNIRDWENQSGNGKDIMSLIRSDLMRSYERQGSFEDFREEVVKEVEDKIMEEIIEKIVREFIEVYLCKTKDFCSS